MGVETMYQPIRYLKPNECPQCGKPILKLVDMDIGVYEIESDGKIGEDVNGCVFYIFCPECKKKYKAEKKGMYTKIQNAQTPTIEPNPFYKDL